VSRSEPGNDGFGLHDNERSHPTAPNTPERSPEEPINLAESGAGLLPLEHDELLAESGCLLSELTASNKVRANIGESRENERNHQSDDAKRYCSLFCKVLIPLSHSGFDDRQFSHRATPPIPCPLNARIRYS